MPPWQLPGTAGDRQQQQLLQWPPDGNEFEPGELEIDRHDANPLNTGAPTSTRAEANSHHRPAPVARNIRFLPHETRSVPKPGSVLIERQVPGRAVPIVFGSPFLDVHRRRASQVRRIPKHTHRVDLREYAASMDLRLRNRNWTRPEFSRKGLARKRMPSQTRPPTPR